MAASSMGATIYPPLSRYSARGPTLGGPKLSSGWPTRYGAARRGTTSQRKCGPSSRLLPPQATPSPDSGMAVQWPVATSGWQACRGDFACCGRIFARSNGLGGRGPATPRTPARGTVRNGSKAVLGSLAQARHSTGQCGSGPFEQLPRKRHVGDWSRSSLAP